jgi:rubrerythrin
VASEISGRGLLVRALREGMDVEARGEAFYSEASEKVENPHGKLTLRFLAREERRHRDYLKDVLRAVKADKPVGESPLPRRSRLMKEELLGRMRQMGVKLKVPEENKEIVRRAIEVEKGSIDFYEGLAGEVKDEGVRRVFQELAVEEGKHLEWLEFIIDSLELHGYWYDLESHFALEG